MVLDDLRNHPLGLRGRRDIGDQNRRVDILRLQIALSSQQLRFIAGGDHDMGTLASDFARHQQSQPARTARDQHDAFREVEGAKTSTLTSDERRAQNQSTHGERRLLARHDCTSL